MAGGKSSTIYAYCNVRTKQVVYSLQPTLHNAHVRKQLPDTGANTSFVSLRKDLWHPLWTLSFPETEHAVRQNLHAFKKLREWRKLHETSWEPPPMLSKPFSEKQIEKLKEALEERGGSKQETVYDIIKHKKKKMRVKEVLNQKANSIADLAAVLIEQDELGTNTLEKGEEESRKDREWVVKDMLLKAQQVENGVLAQNEARIQELEEMRAKADRLGESDVSKTQIRKELQILTKLVRKMRFAAQAVKDAREGTAATTDAAPAASPERSSSEMEQTPKSGNQADLAAARTTSQDAEFKRMLALLPNYPIPKNSPSIPKRGPLRAKIARAKSPIFSTEGVIIKWHNQLDAEFAEAWPETIDHQAMGFARHRAPLADAEPVTDAADARQRRLEKVQAKRVALLEQRRSQQSREHLEAVKVDVLSKVKDAVERKREAARREWQNSQVLA